MAFDEQLIQALDWRHIGPHRGGRVVAVAGDPVEAQTFYFGACAGGVWKTTDGGTYWENVSDDQINVAAIGAIAVAESDPNVVYIGTGEACIRLDVSHGDGVYRSTDGGTTWQHCGLEDTRHISRVRIDPRDADRVYVAALGHAYGPNDERGIFRSLDGGQSWERVLFVSDRAGAADLALDPTNPRILYATIWEAQRYPWNMRSGGDDSGVYRSLDGGDSWERISGNPGFATEMLGRMGVAVSRSRPARIFAVVEAGEGQGGLYRSDDRSESWTRVSKSRDLIGRAWYYCHVFVDPSDAETVWVLNVGCWRSTDGGRNFDRVATPHGDNHDLWIDPATPRRMIEGNDGGACVSFNGAETWSTIYNQPTAQFYHLDIDSQFPYRVNGTQQDNSVISVPSRSRTAGIPYAENHQVGFAESGYIAVHPDDPDLMFAGATGSAPGGGGPIWSYDHRSRQSRLVTVSPESFLGEAITGLTHRFPWTFPISFSPHDSNVLYTTGECVFRSTDLGTSYEPISPDLTRNDPEKLQAAGGPIQLDTTGAETYCTLSVLVESPHEAGTIWVGSDDGLVHITRDGGAGWTEVTPPGVPEWSYISSIDVSAHDPATAYLAATRYKLDDLAPLVFKTSDYGATWTSIAGDLPAAATTRVLREDPTRAGLLYAGSERDLFVTFDDGASWQSLRRNMPAVPIYDLRVHGDDLVAVHSQARLLDPRRSRAAAGADVGGGGRDGLPVHARGGISLRLCASRDRRRGQQELRWRRRGRFRLLRAQGCRRPDKAHLPRRRDEPADRSRRVLPPRRGAGGGDRTRLPR